MALDATFGSCPETIATAVLLANAPAARLTGGWNGGKPIQRLSFDGNRRARRRRQRRVGNTAGVRSHVRITMLVRNNFSHDTRVEKEACTLVEAGHNVTVVADWHPDLPAAESRDGYDVIRVPRPMARVPGLRFLARRQRLIPALIRTRPHILHAHDSDALEPVHAAARRLRIPFVYDAHELWLNQLRRDRSRLYWRAFVAYYWLIERLLIPRAAAVITVSPPIARRLERIYHLRSVAVVSNYPVVQHVAAKDLRSLPGGERIPASAPIVLYIGLIQPGRGIEQLLAAMVQVPVAHLVFLGAGTTTSGIRALADRLGIGGRVHYLGPVPSDEVIDFAASANVGVSAAIPTSLSFEYSLPNKLFQYLAAGLPVVASDFEHVRSVVAANKAGLNVDMREPDRIAGALRQILEDPKRADQMGRNARSAVVHTYNWGNAARELMSTYSEVARRVAK